MYHTSMHDTLDSMTPLSRWKLTSNEEERIKDIFLGELVKTIDKIEMRSLLKSLLTESEYMMIAKRLVAFVFIDEEYTDVQIAKILHITRATANRFRLVYKHAQEKNEPIIEIVHKVKVSEVVKQILKDVLLKYALPAAFGRIPRRGLF